MGVSRIGGGCHWASEERSRRPVPGHSSGDGTKGRDGKVTWEEEEMGLGTGYGDDVSSIKSYGRPSVQLAPVYRHVSVSITVPAGQGCVELGRRHTKLCYGTEIPFLSPDSNSTRNLPKYTDLGLKHGASFFLPQNCPPAPVYRVSLPWTDPHRPFAYKIAHPPIFPGTGSTLLWTRSSSFLSSPHLSIHSPGAPGEGRGASQGLLTRGSEGLRARCLPMDSRSFLESPSGFSF